MVLIGAGPFQRAVVPHGRATPDDGFRHHRHQCVSQAQPGFDRDPSGHRVQPGTPQRLIHHVTARTGEKPLVEQHRLERGTAAGELLGEHGPVERSHARTGKRVRPQAGDAFERSTAWNEHGTAEPSRIPQVQRGTVVEIPTGTQVSAPTVPGVEGQAAGHAEMHDENGGVLEAELEKLAVPSNRLHPAAGCRCRRELRRRIRPGVDDSTARQPRLELTSDRFHLGQLRHGCTVPCSGGPSTREPGHISAGSRRVVAAGGCRWSWFGNAAGMDNDWAWPTDELAALAQRWAGGDADAGADLLLHESVSRYVGYIVTQEGHNDPDVESEVRTELLGYFARGGSVEREPVGAVVRHTVKKLQCPSDLVLTSSERRLLQIAVAVQAELEQHGRGDRAVVKTTVCERVREWAADRVDGDGDIDAKLTRSGMARALQHIDGLLDIAAHGRRLDDLLPSQDGTTLGDSLVQVSAHAATGRISGEEDGVAELVRRVIGGVDEATVHALELLADTEKKDRHLIGARNLAARTGLTQSQASAVQARLAYRFTAPHQMWAFFGQLHRQFDQIPETLDELIAWRLRPVDSRIGTSGR